MTDPIQTVKASLAELARLARKGAQEKDRKKKGGETLVDRPMLRSFLIALGEALEDGIPLEAELEAARADIEKLGERWTRALETEMQLACGEHIQGIDPRYLSHPRYDFEYAIGARQRLELRFTALEALGQPVDPELLERVAEADELMATALEERSRASERG